MNYYERHIGDYLKDTSHLSLLEHGIYTRLLDVYYTREDGIPEEQAARLIGARTKDELVALRSVLVEFFALSDGLHKQDRAEREIARFQDKQAKAKRSAEARWNAKPLDSEGNAGGSNPHTERNANAMRTQCEGNAPRARPQTPDSSNQSPVTNQEGESTLAAQATPPQGEQGKVSKRKKPLLQLPADFEHTPERREYAEQRLPDVDADELFAKFVDLAKSKSWSYADWGLAYLTFVRDKQPNSGHWSAGQYPRKNLNGGQQQALTKFDRVRAAQGEVGDVGFG